MAKFNDTFLLHADITANRTSPQVNGLGIIYKDLEIQQNRAALKWTTQSSTTTYEFQGYTLAKIKTSNLELVEPDAIFRIHNSDTAVIPSANFTNTSGVPLHYRLVALSNNSESEVCSHQETKTTFYRFDGMIEQLEGVDSG